MTDKRMKREGGREERKKIKNGGRDGEREGTRKEKAKPQTVYFLQESYI